VQTEDRVSKKVLAEAPIVCGACGAEFRIRAADIEPFPVAVLGG
jgi:hypothetical protein